MAAQWCADTLYAATYDGQVRCHGQLRDRWSTTPEGRKRGHYLVSTEEIRCRAPHGTGYYPAQEPALEAVSSTTERLRETCAASASGRELPHEVEHLMADVWRMPKKMLRLATQVGQCHCAISRAEFVAKAAGEPPHHLDLEPRP